ncbi:MAG: lysoplasmalogenase [Bacteroidetes bacterium]|nr:MAG: lysoplasmalogenase [Bacteroidota bacterium]TAG90643.1 MAG: lysoplasmalogenase [Bacteroidota bacterium]
MEKYKNIVFNNDGKIIEKLEIKLDVIPKIFLIVVFLNLLSIFIGAFWLELITKPLIVPILLIQKIITFTFLHLLVDEAQTLLRSNEYKDEDEDKNELDTETISSVSVLKDFEKVLQKSSIYNYALFFCFLGDVFLLFNATFLVGLVFFLIAHYIFCRALWGDSNKKQGFVMKNIALVIPFLVYLGTLLYFILPHLKNDIVLQIAVIIYGCALTASGILALNRYNSTSFSSFLYIFIGFLFFIASDTWIAWQKFVLKTDNVFNGLGIMATYIFAMYAITKGSTLGKRYLLSKLENEIIVKKIKEIEEMEEIEKVKVMPYRKSKRKK